MFVTATPRLIAAGAWLFQGLVLFEEMLVSLSRASFRFFDSTPIRRILNRFTKDMDRIDGWLPHTLQHMSTSLAPFIGAVITVAVVVPWFTPLATLVTYCYVRLSMSYLATSRDLRRLESTSLSPILAAFSDPINGIVTGTRKCTLMQQVHNTHFVVVLSLPKVNSYMAISNGRTPARGSGISCG